MKKKLVITCVVFFLLIVIGSGIYGLSYFNLIPKPYYTAKDFGMDTIISKVDYDGDGIDDYTDILLGAREYVQTKPKYKSAYYEGGYPPDEEGVCTDVIWKALNNAGYVFKDLVDIDIKDYVNAYPGVNGKPDPNIDFRRVRNLQVFFERHAVSLSTDVEDMEAWQPGDIVIFPGHIAIVSDRRNKKGQAYIIHHGGQPVLEEDALTRFDVVGHYRWDIRDTISLNE